MMRRERIEESALAAIGDSLGRVEAKAVARLKEPPAGERLALIIGRDLRLEGVGPVFGYADTRRGVVVVSTYRLQGERLGERVEKVLAHEAGHLDGHGHCRDPRCAMHQARSVEELDARGYEVCGLGAPRWRSGTGWGLGAAGVVLVLFLGMDASVRALTRRTKPFAVEGGAVTFRKEVVLRAGDERASEALNAAYMQLHPPALEARGKRAEMGGVTVAEFEGEGEARAWVERMGALLDGKGSRAEGCPDCHVDRRSEVDDSALRRARAWR